LSRNRVEDGLVGAVAGGAVGFEVFFAAPEHLRRGLLAGRVAQIKRDAVGRGVPTYVLLEQPNTQRAYLARASSGTCASPT
jgi:hypothetical protein